MKSSSHISDPDSILELHLMLPDSERSKHDPIASLIRAANDIEATNPAAAERLRFFAHCAELGIDPRLANDPLMFALEVLARSRGRD